MAAADYFFYITEQTLDCSEVDLTGIGLLKENLRLKEWLYWVRSNSVVSIVTSNSFLYHIVGLWTYPCCTSGFGLLDLDLSSLMTLCSDVFICHVGGMCLLNFCFRSKSNSWFSYVVLQALC